MKPKLFGMWFALVAEVLLLTILTSSFGGEEFFQSTFLNWSNLSQVIRAVSYIAIMAVGEAVVIERKKVKVIFCKGNGGEKGYLLSERKG